MERKTKLVRVGSDVLVRHEDYLDPEHNQVEYERLINIDEVDEFPIRPTIIGLAVFAGLLASSTPLWMS